MSSDHPYDECEVRNTERMIDEAVENAELRRAIEAFPGGVRDAMTDRKGEAYRVTYQLCQDILLRP